MFATFALGTALGDLTAITLHLGYLGSAIMFTAIIIIPLVAWRMGLNPVAAFWFAYIVTRPLGPSFADYFSKPRSLSGAASATAPPPSSSSPPSSPSSATCNSANATPSPEHDEAERVWPRTLSPTA